MIRRFRPGRTRSLLRHIESLSEQSQRNYNRYDELRMRYGHVMNILSLEQGAVFYTLLLEEVDCLLAAKVSGSGYRQIRLYVPSIRSTAVAHLFVKPVTGGHVIEDIFVEPFLRRLGIATLLIDKGLPATVTEKPLTGSFAGAPETLHTLIRFFQKCRFETQLLPDRSVLKVEKRPAGKETPRPIRDGCAAV